MASAGNMTSTAPLEVAIKRRVSLAATALGGGDAASIDGPQAHDLDESESGPHPRAPAGAARRSCRLNQVCGMNEFRGARHPHGERR
jgi:hypothetical protein